MERDRSQYRLMVRTAYLHYVRGLTQSKIAERMKLSRASVNRLVQAALDAGIVQFNIAADESLFPDLEQALCDAYELLDAVVVPSVEGREGRNSAIAQGAADWLKPRLRPELVIGLGTGRTIAYLPAAMNLKQRFSCTFCDITGTVVGQEGEEKYRVTSKMAELTGGNAVRIFAPVSVLNPEVHSALLEEPSIAEPLRRAARSEIVIQGVGGLHSTNGLVEHGYLSEDDLKDLRSRGAIGETMGRFFDAKGEEIVGPLDQSIIALTLDSLRQIPWRVCLAGGVEKVDAISAALTGRIFNVLATDFETAQELVGSEQE